MKKIECVIRSEKLKDITDALKKIPVGGMTVSEIRGFGIETGRPDSFLFVHKTKIEIYATDSQVKKIISAILTHCQSGKMGDGKIAVVPLDECVRVRTGEKKNKAILLKGGVKMQKLKVLFLLVTGYWLLVTFCYATPSTHIWAPSTDVQPYKKWHLTSDFYVPTENNSDNSRPNTITNFGLTVGVLPFKKLNAEVGFDHKSGYGALDDWPLYFNTKLGIPEDAFGNFFPALTVGVYDVGTRARDNRTNNNVWYGKAAKTVKVGDLSLGRFSVGGFRGNPKLLLHSGKKDNEGALICWERTMTEISDKLWLAVDYQGSRSSYGALNLGFSWKFSDNTSVIFGYDIYNDRNLANTYTVQVDIDF